MRLSLVLKRLGLILKRMGIGIHWIYHRLVSLTMKKTAKIKLKMMMTSLL